MNLIYKQFKWFTITSRLDWFRWAVGGELIPGMYRDRDRFDLPDAKKRIKYHPTELAFFVGPLYVEFYW